MRLIALSDLSCVDLYPTLRQAQCIAPTLPEYARMRALSGFPGSDSATLQGMEPD